MGQVLLFTRRNGNIVEPPKNNGTHVNVSKYLGSVVLRNLFEERPKMWSLYHTYLFEICFGWLIWVRSRVSLIGQGLGLGLGLAPLGLALGVFPILFVSCTVVRVTHFLGRVVKQNRPPSAYLSRHAFFSSSTHEISSMLLHTAV